MATIYDGAPGTATNIYGERIAARWPRAAGLFVLAGLAVGCASAPTTRRAAEPVTTVRADSAVLPPLAVDQLSEGGVSAQRIRHFDAHNQDVRMVVRALAENFGLGYQLDQDVRGQVSARLENATLEQALASVLGPLGYAFQVEGGVIRVSGARLQTRIFGLDYVSLSRVGTSSTVITRGIAGGGAFGGGIATGGLVGGTGLGSSSGGSSDVIQSTTAADLWSGIGIGLSALVCGDVPADTAATSATTGSPVQPTGLGISGGIAATPTTARSCGGRRLVIDPMAGTILITAPPAKILEAEAYINAIQAAVQRQVLIEAKIVEVRLSRERRFGIDWQMLGRRVNLNIPSPSQTSLVPNTLNFTLGGGASAIDITLRALETQGDVSVLASPRLSALNNQSASFDATTGEVFFAITRQPIIGANNQIVSFNTQVVPQQIAVGIVLNVVPQISADGTITMQVRPTLSFLADIARQALPEGGEVTAPVITTREVNTMARARSGETVVIGGLTQTRRARNRSGVPGLSRVPGVGGLFSSREDVDEQVEIVIFLTPTVIIATPSVAVAPR